MPERSWMGWLFGSEHIKGPYWTAGWYRHVLDWQGMSAVTINKRVYMGDRNDIAHDRLRYHEEAHIAQQEELGWWTFLWAYFWDSAMVLWVTWDLHQAYWHNRFEFEARRKAQEKVDTDRESRRVVSKT